MAHARLTDSVVTNQGGKSQDIMMQDGVWDSKRVLPEGWMKFSTTPGPYPGYGAGFWLGYPV